MAIPISKAKGRLTAQVTASSTSISFTGTDSGRSLESVTMADFGSSGYLTINPEGSVGNYEIVKFTSWSASGSVITIGGLTRNLTLQGTDSGQTGLSFAAGTTVIVANNHHWWNQIANTGIQATTSVAGTVEIATSAEIAAGTSTGGTGAILVPSASNLISYLNFHAFTAGESIDASSTPKAVYLKESDGKVYKCTSASAAEALYGFIGFVALSQSVSADATVYVHTEGTVSGFTGLTAGSYYYATDTAGTISTTAGTKKFQVARAITTTTILIHRGKKVTNGVAQISATNVSTKTIGFKPSSVLVSAYVDTVSFSHGSWTEAGGNQCIYMSAGAGIYNDDSSSSIDAILTVGNSWSGTISNITSTGFDLGVTKTGTVGDLLVFWQAEGV